MIEGAIEELSDLVVELLDAVELEPEQVLGHHAVTRKIHQAMVADVSAKVMLRYQQSVNELAHGHSLAKPSPSDLFVLTSYRALVRLADPFPQVVVERGNTRLDIGGVESAEGRSARVGHHVLDRVLGEGACV